MEPVDEFFQHTGVWAVITTVVVILPTPGETTKKMVNRVLGTTAACIFAVLTGLACYELSVIAYPLGHILTVFINFGVALLGTHMADHGGIWAYAYFLGTLTFVFLSPSILVEDDVWIGIYRVVMIAIGGCIGLFVAWLPPKISATRLAEAYLADVLLDTSLAAEILVDNFLEGHQLNPIHTMSTPEDDDAFHELAKAIQFSRIPLEAALTASPFEGTKKTKVASMEASGLAMRLTLHSMMAADVLLRQEYTPLNRGITEEANLGLALKGVVSSIRSTLQNHKMIDLNFTLHSDDKENFGAGDVSLSQSLQALERCLAEYIHQSSCRVEEEVKTMRQFACHVGFARNMFDAGSHVRTILPQLIDCDIGTSTHHSSMVFSRGT